jgi:hypothetical protein
MGAVSKWEERGAGVRAPRRGRGLAESLLPGARISALAEPRGGSFQRNMATSRVRGGRQLPGGGERENHTSRSRRRNPGKALCPLGGNPAGRAANASERSPRVSSLLFGAA